MKENKAEFDIPWAQISEKSLSEIKQISGVGGIGILDESGQVHFKTGSLETDVWFMAGSLIAGMNAASQALHGVLSENEAVPNMTLDSLTEVTLKERNNSNLGVIICSIFNGYNLIVIHSGVKIPGKLKYRTLKAKESVLHEITRSTRLVRNDTVPGGKTAHGDKTEPPLFANITDQEVDNLFKNPSIF